jgi:hypothetical protein
MKSRIIFIGILSLFTMTSLLDSGSAQTFEFSATLQQSIDNTPFISGTPVTGTITFANDGNGEFIPPDQVRFNPGTGNGWSMTLHTQSGDFTISLNNVGTMWNWHQNWNNLYYCGHLGVSLEEAYTFSEEWASHGITPSHDAGTAFVFFMEPGVIGEEPPSKINFEQIVSFEIPYMEFWLNNHNILFYPYFSDFTIQLHPMEKVKSLAQQVLSLNLQKGISNSLDAKLDAALGALDDLNEKNDVAAINALQAFINATWAQRGQQITETEADELIAMAQEIIDQLST